MHLTIQNCAKGLLNGLRVVELAGLAPVPHCGLMLSDAGANVTVIAKSKSEDFVDQRLTRGKKYMTVDLKLNSDIEKVRSLIRDSDVLLDPYRPGVLERLGLNPLQLLEDNPKLIVCRLTGYGQFGPLSQEAGHDINYVALSGLLPIISGSHNSKLLWPPANLLADFAGGGLTAAFAIMVAIFGRNSNDNQGCIIDCSMVDGLAYLGTFINAFQDVDSFWKGNNAIFRGKYPIYRTYLTKDNKHIAVGALESKFSQALLEALGIDDEVNLIKDDPEQLTVKLESLFLKNTRDEWAKYFEGKNACVTPVLDLDDCGDNEHNRARSTFSKTDGKWIPNMGPRYYSKEQFKYLVQNS